MSSIDRAAYILVRAWINFYRRAPKTTVVSTVAGVLISAVSIYVTEQQTRAIREEKRMSSLNYSKQVQALDETRNNLQSLILFIDSEKQQLRQSQQALQSLRTEHDQLKPLVETDRKAIDALFAAQEARNQAALSTERWIGFALGVISSLVASLLWAVAAYATRRGRGPAA